MTDRRNEAVHHVVAPAELTAIHEWGITLTSSTRLDADTPADRLCWGTAWVVAPAFARLTPDSVPLGRFGDCEL